MKPLCHKCETAAVEVGRLCLRCSLGPVWYMAAPSADLVCAREWLAAITESVDVSLVATWISEVEVIGDDDPAQRKAGLARCMAVIHRCDAIVLVGGSISPGMEQEDRFAFNQGIPRLDLTGCGHWPHDNPEQWISLAQAFHEGAQ